MSDGNNWVKYQVNIDRLNKDNIVDFIKVMCLHIDNYKTVWIRSDKIEDDADLIVFLDKIEEDKL